MSEVKVGQPKFSMETICATPGALLQVSVEEIANALKRHQCGDWGDLEPEDKAANEQAMLEGSRLLSAYHSATGIKFWIITGWDRSVTTVLLPSEY